MSYFVNFVTRDEREVRLVVFPGFLRLLLWFVTEARKCEDIRIFTV